MCGRTTHFFTWAELQQLMRLSTDLGVPLLPPSSFDVKPTQRGIIIRLNEKGQRFASTATFGLVPSWSKEFRSEYSTFNARSETLEKSRAFRTPFKRQRCLVAVSGFFEWQKFFDEKGKRSKTTPTQKWFIRQKDAPVMAFAGLWDRWYPKSDAAEPLDSYTIVMTRSNELIEPMHDRMPVILDAKDQETWLSPKSSPDELRQLFLPFPGAQMECWRVRDFGRKPGVKGPEMIAPLD